MNYLEATQTLAESFDALAEQVQSLIDRKTILEHKLRYAHEQYQSLASKYAPTEPDVSDTLAKLQLPPDLRATPLSHSSVPLPKRGAPDARHQIAILIREGRKASQQLASAMADASKRSGSSQDTSSLPQGVGPETLTTMSTVLEQDFTIEGKKGELHCPFTRQPSPVEEGDHSPDMHDGHADLTGTTAGLTPHQSNDPICAAMLEETKSGDAPADAKAAAAVKCPIRYLDKHSPEEIAHYVETHKHEIPRSHEVCVSRYQKNEAQIRKLDAKYGNLVSMIKDLSHLHQPMLPEPEAAKEDELDKSSNERVETWAQTVEDSDPDENTAPQSMDDDERQSHFDRPLRDVRVGESPSRPWGISVPVSYGAGQPDMERPESPPPAPVQMPSPILSPTPQPKASGGKCPFDHTKLAALSAPSLFRGGAEAAAPVTPAPKPAPEPQHTTASPRDRPANLQPTFLNASDLPTVANQAGQAGPAGGHGAPISINFHGPVFIGYPMDQALQLLQQLQQGQSRPSAS